jgi:hypothetical protein
MLAGQLLVCAKSPGFCPIIVRLVSFRATFWKFLRRTVIGALVVLIVVVGKPSDGGVNVAGGTPLSPAVCGLLAALSETVKVAFLTAFTVGLKVTDIVQVECAVRLLPQFEVCAKSPALDPPRDRDLIEIALFWLLVRVNAVGALVDPTAVGPSIADPGVSAVGNKP